MNLTGMSFDHGILNLANWVGNVIMPTLAAVEKEFAGSGVSFLYVDPTASDSGASIREMMKTHGLRGGVVHDKELALASALEARKFVPTGIALMLRCHCRLRPSEPA